MFQRVPLRPSHLTFQAPASFVVFPTRVLQAETAHGEEKRTPFGFFG